MSNADITTTTDDGFNGSFSSDRTIKGVQLVWNDAQHWRDRDGQKAPEQLLVVAIDAILQRWLRTAGKPEVIRDKPLPDPDALNSAIPIDEWETGIDGQKRPPWADTVVVYFIGPLVGCFYTFVSSTTGGLIAVDHLKESPVAGMRMLRGDRVVPLVELGERPMKTKFGDKSRPHFNIVDWKEPASSRSQGRAGEARPCRWRPSPRRLSRGRPRRPRLSLCSPPRPGSEAHSGRDARAHGDCQAGGIVRRPARQHTLVKMGKWPRRMTGGAIF